MRIFVSTLLLSLLIPSLLQAQNSRETTEPSRFNGFESERGIELLWGIGAGSFCNGIDLQRTSDTNLLSFESIRTDLLLRTLELNLPLRHKD